MGFATSSLKEAGIGIGILVIIITVMAKVLSTLQTANIAESSTYNASDPNTWSWAINITDLGEKSLSTFSDWFAVIVIVLIATVIIALLSFGFGKGRA